MTTEEIRKSVKDVSTMRWTGPFDASKTTSMRGIIADLDTLTSDRHGVFAQEDKAALRVVTTHMSERMSAIANEAVTYEAAEYMTNMGRPVQNWSNDSRTVDLDALKPVSEERSRIMTMVPAMEAAIENDRRHLSDDQRASSYAAIDVINVLERNLPPGLAAKGGDRTTDEEALYRAAFMIANVQARRIDDAITSAASDRSIESSDRRSMDSHLARREERMTSSPKFAEAARIAQRPASSMFHAHRLKDPKFVATDASVDVTGTMEDGRPATVHLFVEKGRDPAMEAVRLRSEAAATHEAVVSSRTPRGSTIDGAVVDAVRAGNAATYSNPNQSLHPRRKGLAGLAARLIGNGMDERIAWRSMQSDVLHEVPATARDAERHRSVAKGPTTVDVMTASMTKDRDGGR